jgi:tetratricopeptide (TPR) repeat protein
VISYPIIYTLITLPVLVISVLFSKNKRNRYILFGLFWFVLFYFIPFIFSDASSYLSHRLYLPLVGFLIILSEIDWLKNLNFQKTKVRIIIILSLTLFYGIAYQHSLNFRSPMSFWLAAIEKSPLSSLAHNNLGSVYSEQNNFEEAFLEFSQSLKLNPEQRMAHYNLGTIYLEKNNFAAAKDEFERELKNNPNFYQAWSNLGSTYYYQGNLEKAITCWQNALKINPGDQESIAWLKKIKTKK